MIYLGLIAASLVLAALLLRAQKPPEETELSSETALSSWLIRTLFLGFLFLIIVMVIRAMGNP